MCSTACASTRRAMGKIGSVILLAGNLPTIMPACDSSIATGLTLSGLYHFDYYNGAYSRGTRTQMVHELPSFFQEISHSRTCEAMGIGECEANVWISLPHGDESEAGCLTACEAERSNGCCRFAEQDGTNACKVGHGRTFYDFRSGTSVRISRCTGQAFIFYCETANSWNLAPPSAREAIEDGMCYDREKGSYLHSVAIGPDGGSLQDGFVREWGSKLDWAQYVVAQAPITLYCPSATQPADLTEASDTLSCTDHWCYRDSWSLDVHWRFQSQNSTSLQSCKDQCLSTIDCTGLEWSYDDKYCVFWLHSACDIRNGSNNAGWHDWQHHGGVTCTKVQATASSHSIVFSSSGSSSAANTNTGGSTYTDEAEGTVPITVALALGILAGLLMVLIAWGLCWHFRLRANQEQVPRQVSGPPEEVHGTVFADAHQGAVLVGPRVAGAAIVVGRPMPSPTKPPPQQDGNVPPTAPAVDGACP